MVRLALLGDIALIGKYDLTINNNAKSRLKLLAEALANYDYVVANLESPLTERKRSLIPKSMHLRSSVINAQLLKFLGINAVSLANNHIYDYGKGGLEDTICALDKNGIEWFGINSKNIIKNINDEKFSLSGFCCYSTNGTGYQNKRNKLGVNTLSFDNIKLQMEKDKTSNALSIMSFHWGLEHTNYPNYEYIHLMNKIHNYNDFLVFGHHPHVIQGIREFNNSLVAFSLGNCLFDDCKSISNSFVLKQNDENKKSFILDAELEKNRISSHSIHGFFDGKNGIELIDISKEVNHISKQLNISKNKKCYENLQKMQFDETIKVKFGKHDIKWLKSRINYYSVGAFLLSKIRNIKYQKELAKFYS